MEEKTPHSHSMDVVYREGGRPLKLLGETKAREVESNDGLEQELFLIEREYYVKRPDLTAAESRIGFSLVWKTGTVHSIVKLLRKY